MSVPDPARTTLRPGLAALALLLLTSTGCAPGVDPPDSPSDALLRIVLARDSDALWDVTYRATVPVDALNFGPAVGRFRSSSFTLPAGFELVEVDGEEHVRRLDGSTFDSLSLRVRSFNELVPKKYVAFNDFSDGGVSVFTGCLLPGLTRENVTVAPDGEFDFIPREGEFIVHDGSRSEGVEGFRTDQLTAPFVYFGQAELTQTDSLIAVVDPAFPDPIRDRLTSQLPEIFARLESGMQRKLTGRPMILASAHEIPGFRGVSTKGGTRKGQIQIRLRAESLSDLGEANLQHMTKFFAHEGAHLWQEPVLADDQDAWIHEGGADALALAVIEDLGAWDDERLRAARRQARDECAGGFEGFSLPQAADRGRFDLYYSCGLVIALATEAELRRDDENATIETFWRALYTSAMEDRTPYTPRLYLDTLLALGGRPEVADAVERFISEGHDDARGQLDALLTLTGAAELF